MDCEGCKINHPSQIEHMGIGGCLGPDISLLEETNVTTEKKTEEEVKEEETAHPKNDDAVDGKSTSKKCDFRVKKSKVKKGYRRGKTRKTIVTKPFDISVDENFKQLDNDVRKAVLTKRREAERLTVLKMGKE